MHSYIIEMGFDSDAAIGNTLINAYGMLGSMEDAARLFGAMHIPDVLSWTAMITIYVQHGCHEAAIRLFETVDSDYFRAVKETFLVILEAYGDLSELTKGEALYVSIVCKGLNSDPAVATALVNLYGKCGSPLVARNVFQFVEKKDVILWTAIITVHAQHGYASDAQLLFAQMQQEGIPPNGVTFLNVLTACSHAGLVDEGQHFLTSMVMNHGISPTVDHYDCMIDLFGRAGLLEPAENLVVNMPFPPRIVSFMALLGACKCQDDIDRGSRIAECVFDMNPEISAPYVMLSNMIATSFCPVQPPNLDSVP
jgi:pentatricopeptide repeat protein